MHKVISRLVVASFTLLLGVALSQVLEMTRRHQNPPQPPSPCATPTPTSEQQSPDSGPDKYPDSDGITPSEIASFIDQHPNADLDRLWDRLGVKTEPGSLPEMSICSDCKAEMTDYDLDGEPGDESLLTISDRAGETTRVLVFKHVGKKDDWKVLGHVDAWGKYRDPQALVLLSGGETWLVVQGQSASGSGVALYNTTVFKVTSHRLIEIVFYQSEGHQSSFEAWPNRDFTSRILSCQSEQGRSVITIEFKINYSTWSAQDKGVPLFSKRQIAVFIKPTKGEAFLDTRRSTLTNRELDHIYNIDSMTDIDLLKYNYVELVELARKGNKAQRAWLKSLLADYATDSEPQRKLTALVK